MSTTCLDDTESKNSTPAWMRYLPKPPWTDTYKPLQTAVPLSNVGSSRNASVKPKPKSVKAARCSKFSSGTSSVIVNNIQQQPFHRQARELRQVRSAVDKHNRIQRKLRSNINVDEASMLLSFVKSE